jgi:hypothetical protein
VVTLQMLPVKVSYPVVPFVHHHRNLLRLWMSLIYQEGLLGVRITQDVNQKSQVL